MNRIIIYLILFFVFGVSAFFITNDKISSILIGLCSSIVLLIIDHIILIYNRIRLIILCYTKYRKSYIRFSISYLFKIKVLDKYLLVRGHRLKDQFQPVGGVYKRFSSSNSFFRKHKILDDEFIPIDDISKDDLRILVPAPKVWKFLKWFNSKKERELSPEREFKEELIKTNILSEKHFESINYTYIGREETKIKFSEYFQCYEILIADIYELECSDIQIVELKKTQLKNSNEYIWVNAETIRKRGYQKDDHVRISDTAKWIL